MANKTQKIHYIEDFTFSFVYPFNMEYEYVATVKTLGLNVIIATWKYQDNVWVCTDNVSIDGDEITFMIKEHNLPAGKVMVHVQENLDNDEVNCFDIDPNIILTYGNNVLNIDPDEVDNEQDINITNLQEELKKVKEDVVELDGEVDELEKSLTNLANEHHSRLDNLDEVTTASQAAIDSLNENLDKLGDDVEANYERILDLEKRFEDKEDFFGEMTEDFSTLSQRQEALTTLIGNFTTDYDERLDRYDTALYKAQQDIDVNATNIKDLQNIQGKLLDEFDKEIANINERITNLVVNAGSGNADLSDVYSEINQIKQDAAQLRRYVDTINNHEPFNPSYLQGQIDNLKTRISYFDQFEHDNYLTEHQDISHLATKTELANAINSIDVTDQLENIATITYVENKLSNYAKLTDVHNYDDTAVKNRLTALESQSFDNFVTKTEFNSSLSAYQPKGNYALAVDLNDYQVKGNYAYKSDLTNLATKDEIANFITAADVQPYNDTQIKARLDDLEAIDHSKYVRKSYLEEFYQPIGNYAKVTDLSDYATKNDIKDFITTPYDDTLIKSRLSDLESFTNQNFAYKSDLTQFVTNSNLNTTLSNYITESKLNLELQNYATINDIPDVDDITDELDDIKRNITTLNNINHDIFAKKTELDDYVKKTSMTEFAKVTDLSYYQPKGNYLTQHQDISNLATKSEVDTKVSQINTNLLTNYFTKTEVNSLVSTAGYDDTEIKSKISSLEAIDHSKYLTQHQDISNLATKSEVNTKVNALQTLLDAIEEGENHVFVDMDTQNAGNDENTIYFMYSEQTPRHGLYFYDDVTEKWVQVQ